MAPDNLYFAYTENYIMRNLKHASILGHKGFFEDQNCICIVQELMSASLSEVYYDRLFVGQLDEAYVCKLFYLMVQSVVACHQSNVVHRDIKLENFLVDIDENDQVIVKLTDFGIACIYDSNDPPTRQCGTLPGIAPEIIKN